MERYMVFVTCSDGELRCYHPMGDTINALIGNAIQEDLDNYPDKPADWNNYSIVRGINLYDVAHGRIV